MIRSLWLRTLFDLARSRKDRRRLAARSRKPVRLLLEPLEDRITPSGFQSLYSFTGGSDGSYPEGGVIVDSSGNLYGTTTTGGPREGGTVFRFDSGGTTVTTLNSFTGSDGSAPSDFLIRDSKGNLYGTTFGGGISGVSGAGTVFELSSDGSTLTDLFTFNDSDGSQPDANLIMDSKGNLYGTAFGGGTSGDGTVFELSPNGSGSYNLTTLHNFDRSDGTGPEGAVTMDSNGNLYGTTSGGGTANDGTVYELSPNGSGGYNYSILHNFTGSDGRTPSRNLIMDSQGNLYGVTVYGGTQSEGTVFKISSNGASFGVLHSFNLNDNDGWQPDGTLVMDSKGNLYGITSPGSFSDGTVFELSPNGSGGYNLTTLHSFTGSDGDFPNTGLTADSSGNLYGTTSLGGTNNDGTIFEITGVFNTFVTTTSASNVSAAFSANTQNVTLTANVNSDSGSVNEGTVTFTILQGSIIIGTATTSDTVSNGQASVSYALPFNLAAGTYTIDAVYNPGPDFSGSSDNTHTLTVLPAPTVTTNPSNQTVTAGQTAAFTAAASGNPTPTVQWQVSTDGGNTFTDISGATSTNLTLSNVQASQNGDEYQAIFTNSLGTATTSAAVLTVQYAPTVTTNPASQTVTAGQTATFTAAASGNPTPTVQWQVSSDGGNTWTNISGATSTTLTLTSVPASQNGNEYQAVFTNSIGTVSTSAATLTVDYAPAVTTIPNSQTMTAGQTATFTAAANGNPTPSVQWQVSSDSGSTWSNINGATSTTLTLSNVQASQNGYEYQAVFTNSVATTTTSAVTLTVQLPPTVSTNPGSQAVTAGDTATFTAAADGNPTPTVQWQLSSDRGKTWTDISGATATTLTLNNVPFSQNGNEYRAVFTNSVGSGTTTAATLTLQTTPTIISGNNATFTIGQAGSFTLTATGSPTPTFTESGALPGGITFTDNGNGTATLSGALAAGTQGTYHFTITAHNGVGSDFTQSFTLTVNPAPTPSPPRSPVLNVPPLLALLDSLLRGTETINANGTETITESLFGIALVVATYDGSGNFVGATLLGFNIPNWVWSL